MSTSTKQTTSLPVERELVSWIRELAHEIADLRGVINELQTSISLLNDHLTWQANTAYSRYWASKTATELPTLKLPFEE